MWTWTFLNFLSQSMYLKKDLPDYLTSLNGIWMKRLCLRYFLVSHADIVYQNICLLQTTEVTQAGLGRRGCLWWGCWGVCLPEPESRDIAWLQEQLVWWTFHLNPPQLISASLHRAASLSLPLFFLCWCTQPSSPKCKTYDQEQPFQLLEPYWSVFLSLSFRFAREGTNLSA